MTVFDIFNGIHHINLEKIEDKKYFFKVKKTVPKKIMLKMEMAK